MKNHKSLNLLLMLCTAIAILNPPRAAAGSHAAEIVYGEPVSMGQGSVRSYLALDTAGGPVELGLLIHRSSLEGLPRERSTSGRCFDLNGNGQIDPPDECEGDYEFVVSLPSEVRDRADIPFRWIGANWNPAGHAPPGIYHLPHFDFHFYVVDEESVRAIKTGTCGFFMDCDQFEIATRPVPARYVHKDHVNVDAAVAAMGNHLIDLTSPEFAKPPQKFTHTWIFGAYDGRITFYEPMITLEYFQSNPNGCTAIKQPQAWERPGYYPTRYCIRHHAKADKYTVSLEGFRYRNAD